MKLDQRNLIPFTVLSFLLAIVLVVGVSMLSKRQCLGFSPYTLNIISFEVHCLPFTFYEITGRKIKKKDLIDSRLSGLRTKDSEEELDSIFKTGIGVPFARGRAYDYVRHLQKILKEKEILDDSFIERIRESLAAARRGNYSEAQIIFGFE